MVPNLVYWNVTKPKVSASTVSTLILSPEKFSYLNETIWFQNSIGDDLIPKTRLISKILGPKLDWRRFDDSLSFGWQVASFIFNPILGMQRTFLERNLPTKRWAFESGYLFDWFLLFICQVVTQMLEVCPWFLRFGSVFEVCCLDMQWSESNIVFHDPNYTQPKPFRSRTPVRGLGFHKGASLFSGNQWLVKTWVLFVDFFSQLLLHFSEVMTKERHPRPLRLSGTFPNWDVKTPSRGFA